MGRRGRGEGIYSSEMAKREQLVKMEKKMCIFVSSPNTFAFLSPLVGELNKREPYSPFLASFPCPPPPPSRPLLPLPASTLLPPATVLPPRLSLPRVPLLLILDV